MGLFITVEFGGVTNIQSITNGCHLAKGREMGEVGVESIEVCSRLARRQSERTLKGISRR